MTSDFTDDAFLGGRLLIKQPKQGFRSGSDAVFLAAAVSAQPGQTVLDVGSGPGTALLCLTHRLPHLVGFALDDNEVASACARENIQRVPWNPQLKAVHASLFDPWKADLLPLTFDHILTNPPYFDQTHSHPSPVVRRAQARHGEKDLWDQWLKHCLKRLHPKGTLTVILPTERLTATLLSVHTHLGALRLYPLWPRPGLPAKRLILQGTKGSKASLKLLPGLVLHEGAGNGFTTQASRILKDGYHLDLKG
jgi:tRNA1Val (adenine37-N6)-methyltransferase